MAGGMAGAVGDVMREMYTADGAHRPGRGGAPHREPAAGCAAARDQFSASRTGPWPEVRTRLSRLPTPEELVIPAIRAAGLAFAALAPLAGRPAAAQQPFEGVITVRTTSMQAQQQDAQYYVRQGASRVEMTSSRGQMVLVTDPQKQTMYMMMPEQKTYMERPLAQPPGPVTKDAPAEPQVVRTGRTDTIAGFQCEHVTITTERGTADACMTRQLGAIPAMGAGMRRGMGGQGGGAGGGGAGARGGAMGGNWRTALDAQP